MPKKSRPVDLSRRQFLGYFQGAPLAFLPAGLPFRSLLAPVSGAGRFASPDLQLHPEYRTKRAMDAILRRVPAGFDDFVTEKYQDQIEAILRDWTTQLLASPRQTDTLDKVMTPNFSGSSFKPTSEQALYDSGAIKTWRVRYAQAATLDRESFLAELRSSFGTFSKLLTIELQIVRIRATPTGISSSAESTPLATTIRFQLVGTGDGFHREQRVGQWELLWGKLISGEFQLQKWTSVEEERSRASVPVFQDISFHAFGSNSSYRDQLIPGTDYWRTVLDGASGIDIYAHNGVAVADVNGDDLDDIYICQPSGLPNRLFRNRGDGTFEDITDSAGVGVLEYSACALFADIDNDGRQDLIVVRASGPLLFLNQGNGKFRLKPDAFQFANPPQGTFTGAAVADYDRDGWVDVYFCLYSYYQGADQYRYPMPYFDAENGPPNFLMRNNHDGTFRDVTKQSGMDQNNTRYSFTCVWGDYDGDNWLDLYVVNDFGRKNLYHNNRDGTFTDVAKQTGVEDIGAGMSGAWVDFDNGGRDDLYVANMWTAAGIRVSEQDIFQKDANKEVRSLYQQHAMGNSLFRNKNGGFEDVSERTGTMMGRWSWSSDAWDFNHDGFPDLYIANGFISGTTPEDLNSFFWRQVVANSPNEPRPSHEYEQAWNAINDLIRSDYTWSGFERNVFYLNNGDEAFSDISGITEIDFVEDGRTFALGDFDLDGRPEIVLKNRNGPQLRYLKNVLPDLPPAISFRLIGKKSNRDAIGARVTIETKAGRQSRSIRCGSGFLAQHSRELFFGLGDTGSPISAVIEWPSGGRQKLDSLPLNHRIWVEEGSPPMRMEPYVKLGKLPVNAVALPETLNSPRDFETWLLVPVPAPDFSIPGSGGRAESLSSLRGNPVLLHFWSASLPEAEEGLGEFDRAYAEWSRKNLKLIALNVDGIFSQSKASLPMSQYSFPVFQAPADVVAVYNLVFRQLFDRHHDISVPVSLLVNEEGNIVKIYQGAPSPRKIESDFQSIPKNNADRLAKALPFSGLTETYSFGRNYLSFGFVFYEHGYFEQARQFFAQAVEEDDASAEALYGLGSAYLQLQKNSEARDCFERALKLHASYPGTLPNCWNNLGILSARAGNSDEAIQYFQHALQIDPGHTIALQNLGSAYRQKKDWPQAKSTLERALALNPDDPEANYSLGMVYAQQSDTEHAYDYLQKALTEKPVYPEALNNLGILYLRTQRPTEAIQSFEQSIRVAPSYDQAYLNLARVYVIEGDREKAKSILQQLLKERPDQAEATKELRQLEQ